MLTQSALPNVLLYLSCFQFNIWCFLSLYVSGALSKFGAALLYFITRTPSSGRHIAHRAILPINRIWGKYLSPIVAFYSLLRFVFLLSRLGIHVSNFCDQQEEAERKGLLGTLLSPFFFLFFLLNSNHCLGGGKSSGLTDCPYSSTVPDSVN